jgi:hypothetical protein
VLHRALSPPHFITVNESEMMSEKKKLRIKRKKNCEKEEKRGYQIKRARNR